MANPLTSSLSKLSGLISSLVTNYSSMHFIVDAIMIFAFFLTVLHFALKKTMGEEKKRLATILSTIITIMITFSLMIFMNSQSLMLLSGTLGKYIVIPMIFVIVTGIIMSLFKEHKIGVAFAMVFVLFGVLSKYVPSFWAFVNSGHYLGDIVWLIWLASGIYAIWLIISVFVKSWGEGTSVFNSARIKSKKEMDDFRKVRAQKDMKKANRIERNMRNSIRNEIKKIKKAKNIVKNLLRDLGNPSKNNKDIIKHIDRLAAAKVGIGGYAGLAKSLAEKTEKLSSTTTLKSDLDALSNSLIGYVTELNTAVTTLVGCCRGGTITNRNNVTKVATELKDVFEKMIKDSMGVLALDEHITDEIEKSVNP